ncbi:hypothetical protein FIU89_09465 [Roseovarius sp. THAF27]|uniref:hypothetical protein n=1 Tax=Roseovarius sp. THAF27 TaxID=2587850 RepID=UPI0012696711|nr:hypothetical protein [Roseovarius sp. THAF27]QFT80835.1 hypothetical protein FIU89_09465 [Roseovarius sp. THAF27]
MTDHIRQAFIRAAEHSPSYHLFTLYTQATDATHGRPVAGRFVAVEGQVHGRVKFADTDQLNRTLGGEVGEGQVTLLTEWAFTPAALRDETGQWYSVTGALGQDSLGVGTRLAVKRWAGDAPVVEDEVP